MKTMTKPTILALHTAALTGFLSLALLSTATAADFSGSLKGVSITDAQATNKPPVGAFTYTKNGNTFTFDASGASDPDGTIANYSWDFGDGSTGTGATITHQYSTMGTYPVTLTLVDNTGGVALEQLKVSLGTTFYWSMDSMPTTSMTSDFGNVTITKYMNGASSVPGVKGNAMAQTDTNQAYTIPMSAVPATKGTIQLYVKHDFASDSSNRFLFKTTDLGKANTIYAYLYKSTLYFLIYDPSGSYRRIYTTLSIVAGTWYKYEFIWDASAGYIGIKRNDSLLVEQKPAPWSAPTWGASDNLFIGASMPVGSFDEFTILTQ